MDLERTGGAATLTQLGGTPSGATVPLSGGTMTGLLTATQGVTVAGPGNAASVNGYTPLVDFLPSDADPSDVALLVKIPGPTWGVAQRYGEGNALVFADDADNFVGTPGLILGTISATTNATPVAVTLSSALCSTSADPTGVDNSHIHSGDIVRITGTGIAALDNKFWKVTVTSTTAFTLTGSTAPGSTAAVGYAFTDRASIIARLSDTGFGVNGLHVPVGLRGRSRSAIPTQAAWIQQCADMIGLTITNPGTAYWTPTPTANYLQAIDTRAANAQRFAINAAGQTVVDAAAGAAAPALTFAGETDKGVYSAAAGFLSFAVGGVAIASFISTGLAFADAKDISTGTGTGMKIATGTSQKLGFYNATPIARRAGAAQTAVAATGSSNSSPFGYTTAAQADAIVTLVNELRAWAVAQGFIKGSA